VGGIPVPDRHLNVRERQLEPSGGPAGSRRRGDHRVAPAHRWIRRSRIDRNVVGEERREACGVRKLAQVV
jgi:hypothetical protein